MFKLIRRISKEIWQIAGKGGGVGNLRRDRKPAARRRCCLELEVLERRDVPTTSSTTVLTSSVANLSLTSSGQYVNVGNPVQLQATGVMSIAAEINATAFNGQSTIVGKWGDTDFGTAGYLFYVSGDTLTFLTDSTGSGDFHEVSGPTLSTNTTYFVVADYDGSDLNVYVNGALVDSTAYSGSIHNTPADFQIGSYNSDAYSASQWSGTISDVRFYNSALTLAQVQEIYNSGNGLVTAGSAAANLVGWWPLSEGSGSTAFDNSGSGNDGIIVGSPAWITVPAPSPSTSLVGQPVTFTATVASGPENDYSFNDGSGTTVADSGWNPTNGSLSGTSNWSADVPSELSGTNTSSFAFDGSDDSVTTANLSASQFSLSFWIELASSPVEGNNTVASGSYQLGLFPYYFPGDEITFVNGDIGAPAVSSGISLDTGWHNVVMTYDGNNITFWIDGTEGDSGAVGTVSTDTTLGGSWQIGSFAGYTNFLDANLSEFRFYNYVLSSGQIAGLAAGTLANSGMPTGTVDFYNGETLLGSSTLSNGVATYTTNSLNVGTQTISAVYSGDDNFDGSTSSNLDQAVDAIVTLANPGAQTNADGDTAYLALFAADSVGNSTTYSATNLPPGLSIDSSTGVISGTVTSGDDADSPYTVTVTAADSVEADGSVSQSFAWTINPTGTITVSLTGPSNRTNVEDDSPTLDLSATDSASNPLIYGAANLPPGLTIDPTTGIISGSIEDGASGSSPYTVTVTATDSTNPSVGAGQTFTWTLHPLVTLTSPGTVSNADGDTAYLALAAVDSAGNDMTYSASGLPAGLSIDSSTGVISGTVTSGDHTYSPYSVTVTATDSVDDAGTASQSFTWDVSATGSITVSVSSVSDQSNNEEDTADLSVSASDSASNTLVYGASNLPPGLFIDPSSGVISGIVGDFDSVFSPYTVTVTATDSVNPSVGAAQTFTWTVSPLVVVTNPGTLSNADGDTVLLPTLGTDSAGNRLTFTATGLPPGLSIDPNSGVISGTIASGADADSPYSVTVTATDTLDGSATASQTFDWDVGASGTITVSFSGVANQASTEEQYIDLTVSATDSASNTLLYEASNLPPGLTIDPSSGVISGTIADDASAGSPYTVIVTATDSTNPSVGASYTLLNWSVTPVVDLSSIPASVSDVEGDSVSLGLPNTDTAGNPLTFTAANLPSGLTINPDTGVISGTISTGDSADSPYSVTITATDTGGTYAVASQTISWSVAASGSITVSLTSPGDQSNVTGDSVSLSISASDSGSNPLIYSATGLPAGLCINPNTGVISGVIAEGADVDSPYTVTVTATDASLAGASASQTFYWTVGEISTVELLNPGSQTIYAGEQVLIPFEAIAPDSATVAFSATGLPPGLYIDSVTGYLMGTVQGAATPATYTVSVTASDGTSSNTVSFNMNIIPWALAQQPAPAAPSFSSIRGFPRIVRVNEAFNSFDQVQVRGTVLQIPQGWSILAANVTAQANGQSSTAQINLLQGNAVRGFVNIPAVASRTTVVTIVGVTIARGGERRTVFFTVGDGPRP